MNEETRKMIDEMTGCILEFKKTAMVECPLSQVEEIRLELLSAIYRTSPDARRYVELTTDLYDQAVFEKKFEILMDGLRKLGEAVFPD